MKCFTFFPKMHQNSFGWRAPPGPIGTAYSPLAGLKGSGWRNGEREGGEGDDWMKEMGGPPMSEVR